MISLVHLLMFWICSLVGSDAATTNHPGKVPSGLDLPSDLADEKQESNVQQKNGKTDLPSDLTDEKQEFNGQLRNGKTILWAQLNVEQKGGLIHVREKDEQIYFCCCYKSYSRCRLLVLYESGSSLDIDNIIINLHITSGHYILSVMRSWKLQIHHRSWKLSEVVLSCSLACRGCFSGIFRFHTTEFLFLYLPKDALVICIFLYVFTVVEVALGLPICVTHFDSAMRILGSDEDASRAWSGLFYRFFGLS